MPFGNKLIISFRKEIMRFFLFLPQEIICNCHQIIRVVNAHLPPNLPPNGLTG